MNIVVVESPAKAKTINKYLGPGYEVLASFGHIRDLPAKDGSVDPNSDFRMLWEVDARSNQRINDIARALKGADKLILATDPDREGEAISWHVLEVLKEKKAFKDVPIERVVFNAITKQAVTEAMKHPRTIDAALVDAYLARRALDLLVLERLLLLEHLQHVPGDGLALTVGVGCEDQLVGAFQGAGDIVNALVGAGIDLPQHAEVGIGVD